MTTRKELLPGVFLTSIQDGRFKTACFSLSFLRPLRADDSRMDRRGLLRLHGGDKIELQRHAHPGRDPVKTARRR